MYTTNFVDHSVVRLKDGRTGTIVHKYSDGLAMCVEVDDDTHELVDVEPQDVDKVIWLPK